MRVRWGLCAVLVSAACGTPMSFVRTGDASRPMQPRGPAQVDVFTTGAPARPHLELGVIESQQDDPSARDEHEVVAKMREYAGELGCDALVMHEGQDGQDRAARKYRGSCVVYTAPPLLQPPPVAAGSAGNSCIPNSTQPCYGPGGCSGSHVCSADGKSFTGCNCAAPGSP